MLASDRCSAHGRPAQLQALHVCTLTRGPAPPETPEDWTELQLRNAEYESLISFYSDYGSTQNRGNTFQPHHPLHRPTPPQGLTVSHLLAAGAQMGHSQSLMNPNFLPYAYGVRAGITVIDLDHTVPLLRRAAQVVRAVALRGGMVVFVGTRADLRPVVRKAAERIGERAYHLSEKWLAGTLTNRVNMFGLQTVHDEQVIPDLVIFLNPIPNLHAIRECTVHHVPTIALVDSNVDPRIVTYPIPANDESTRTAELVAGILSIAGREGVAVRREEFERQAARAVKLQVKLQRVREAAWDPHRI
ncbi:ribosomal protein S2, flavodoxin-like domain-containing protein [Fomitopsis serialis]|uniref:ribosomal protein S2, flavodoxin-like domain-containing protein n=1 Tax=Fomitopsis serialis TaxID=139415 RepID=UPI002008D9E7|nr:ribosomal protein S2, flavodoxin-like domain-containing protein [Neoantrodia serialis]KAH9934940.1 ribosomal protein S2, flavodoxin-like domain-containing protein [Neoantrodia serialis]